MLDGDANLSQSDQRLSTEIGEQDGMRVGQVPRRRQPMTRSLVSHIWAKASWLALIVIGVFITSGAVYPILPRTYEATAQLYLDPTDRNGQPIVGHSSLNAFDENQIQAYQDMLASRPLLDTVIAQHHLMDNTEYNPLLRNDWKTRLRQWLPLPAVNPEEAVENTARTRLVVRRDRKSYVVRVGFWSADPDLAAAMANTMATAFVADQLGHRQDTQRQLVAGLTRRASELQEKYLASEAKKNAYLISLGLNHSDQQRSDEQQLLTLSGEYARASAAAIAAQDRAQTLTDMAKAGTLDNASEVLSSTIVRDLKERLITLSAGTGVPASIGAGSAAPANLNELRILIGTDEQRILRSAQIEAAVEQQHAKGAARVDHSDRCPHRAVARS